LVALFGDGPKRLFAAAGVLPRREPEPGGKIASRILSRSEDETENRAGKETSGTGLEGHPLQPMPDAGRSTSSNALITTASSFYRSGGSSNGSFARISRNRRLMRDFEHYAATVAAFVRLAMIRLILKRLTKSSPCS
jgi:hypothetical protein